MKSVKNSLKKWIKPVEFNGWGAQILYAIPRFLAGMVLAIDFGASKFGMPWTGADRELGLFEVAAWFPDDVAQFGAPFSWAPVLFAWLGAASEAIGGIFLAIGLGTRFWAVMIGGTMLVAIFFQKWSDFLEQGFWSILPALGFLWVCIYCLIFGSGKLGLDHWIAKRWS